ncbi:MAG: BatA domain-containing protein [Gemmataceae bacterium]
MSFLAPYMLWGALAAGIPIALHFFYRSRHRDVPWGAMKFLLAAIEQTSRRLRFQELLLLILRVCILLLLALTLARPSTSAAGRGGRGDAVDAVLILDTSMSMAARSGVAPPAGPDVYTSTLRQAAREDGGVRAFDRARAAAAAVLASLPPHSTMQLIASSDRAALLGPRSPSHLDEGKALIEEIPLTDRGTDHLPGVQLAARLLDAGPSPNKELYLFSDMQRSGFEARSSSLVEALGDLRRRVSVHFVHCGASKFANVSLFGITPQSPPRAGERADFAVLVRNTGKEVVKHLTVTLEIDGGHRDAQPLAEVRPGETRAAALSVPIDRPGRHVLTASLRGDDLDADNRFDQVIHVADRAGILILDGAPDARDARRSASYFLRHALDPSPGEAALPVTVVTPEKASPRDLGGKEVCLLVNARLEAAAKEGGHLAPEFVRALGAFVQEGRSLVVFAGDRVTPEPYNRLLFDQLRLLPYRIAKVENAPRDRPFVVDRQSADEPPYLRFRDERGYAGLDRVEVRRLLALDPSDKALADESRVLLRYSGGLPAVASRKRAGQGEVLLFTTSVNDPAWSDWFVSPAFVPFVQETLGHLLEGRPRALNRVAGDPLVRQVTPAEAETAFDLVPPDGQRRRLGYPVSVGGLLTVTADDVDRAGLYRISPVGEERPDEPTFAVVPQLRETEEMEALTSEQIDRRLGFAAHHATAGDDGSVFSGAARLRREWTPWLLGVLLVAVVAEMVFAWYCGRSW